MTKHILNARLPTGEHVMSLANGDDPKFRPVFNEIVVDLIERGLVMSTSTSTLDSFDFAVLRPIGAVPSLPAPETATPEAVAEDTGKPAKKRTWAKTKAKAKAQAKSANPSKKRGRPRKQHLPEPDYDAVPLDGGAPITDGDRITLKADALSESRHADLAVLIGQEAIVLEVVHRRGRQHNILASFGEQGSIWLAPSEVVRSEDKELEG